MMLNKKKKFVLLFALLLIISNQLKASDTLILVPNPKIEIKFNYSPLTIIKWSVPNYDVIYSIKYSPDDHQDKKTTKSYTNFGIGCLYNIKKNIWLGLNFSYFTQGTSVGVIDNSNSNFNKSISLETYQQVFQFNFNVILKIKDTKMNKNGTSFSFGIAPEFANKENQWTMILTSKDGTKLAEEQDFEIFNKKQKFVRITPSISIMRYCYNSKRNFSFNYGSSFSFKSVYEIHKHSEYLQNYKVIPIVIGFSYHFK